MLNPLNHRFLATSTLLMTCLLSWSSVSVAKSKDFGLAVSTYLEGFQMCVEANSLRGINLSKAQFKFRKYEALTAKAAQIDPEILNTNASNMRKNLAFCERVQDNLLKAQAIPVIEEGFQYCEQAKFALQGDTPVDAQEFMEQYHVKKNRAYDITTRLDESYAIARKKRSCDRLQSKIDTALNELKMLNQTLLAVDGEYKRMNQRCETLDGFLAGKAFGLDTLQQAETLQAKVAQQKKVVINLADSIATLEEHQERDDIAKTLAYGNSIRGCDQASKRVITQFQIEKQGVQQRFLRLTGTIKQGITECEAANRRAFRATSITEASKIKNTIEAASLALSKSRQSPPITELLQKHSTWPEAKTYNEQVAVLSQCHDSTKELLVAARQKIDERERLAKQSKQKEQERLAARRAMIQAEKERIEKERLKAEQDRQAALLRSNELEKDTNTEGESPKLRFKRSDIQASVDDTTRSNTGDRASEATSSEDIDQAYSEMFKDLDNARKERSRSQKRPWIHSVR